MHIGPTNTHLKMPLSVASKCSVENGKIFYWTDGCVPFLGPETVKSSIAVKSNTVACLAMDYRTSWKV